MQNRKKGSTQLAFSHQEISLHFILESEISNVETKWGKKI